MKKEKIFKKWKVVIDSIVGLISNSSTTIYTTCHSDSIKNITELLETILKATGSKKSVADLFEIKLFQHEWNDDADDEIKQYENIDFNDESTPVQIEVTLKENNKNLSELLNSIFETKEFLS